MAEVGTVTSSAADSLEELKKRREEEEQARKAQEAQSKDETKSPSQKSSEEKQSERAQAQQRQNNNPFRAETRAQSQASPQERLKAAVPGYKDDQSPETQEKNAELLLKRLSDQIEESKEKMGAERDEYPGAPAGLSAQQQVATAQIAAEQRQSREEKLTEAQRQAVEQKETIYDLAKELIDRGLHKEAEKILGRHLLGEDADKTVKSLEETIKADEYRESTETIQETERRAEHLQEQENRHNGTATENRHSLDLANYDATKKSRAAQKDPRKQGLADQAIETANQKRKILREHNTSESSRARHNELLELKQSVSEAKRLLSLGDHEGARKVAQGESYQRQEEFNARSLELSEVPERERYAELPTEARSSLNYKDALDEHILERQESLSALQTQAENLRTQHAAYGNTGEQRAEIQRQEEALQEQIAEQTRTLEQSQQYQAHVAALIDQGNHGEIAKLKSGEATLETTVSYNSPTASQEVLARTGQESVQELLIDKATTVQERAQEIQEAERSVEAAKQVQRPQNEAVEKGRRNTQNSPGRGGVEARKRVAAKAAIAQKHQDEVLSPALEKARALQDSQRKDSMALLEATKLIEAGDLEGARKVLTGESYGREELLSVSDGQKLINPEREAEIGREAYNTELTQQFRETLQANIEQGQSTLIALNTYMIAAQRMIDEPSVSAEHRQKILDDMTKTEIQRQEYLRATSQLQQLHTKLTELQVSGNTEAARALIEGKQGFVSEQTYNPGDQDYAQVATQDYSRTEAESKELAEKLLAETTHMRAGAERSVDTFTKQKGPASIGPERAKALFNHAQKNEAKATSHIESGKYEEAIQLLRQENVALRNEREEMYGKANEKFREAREDFEKKDRYWGYAETATKTAGYVAVGAAAAAATGGAAAALLAANYGTLLVASGAIAAGTAGGTAAGFALEGGRGLVGMASGQTSEQAFENFWGKVGEHAKNSLIDSVATYTGLKVVQTLTKAGGASTALKITANAAGGGTESLVSFGINTVDARYQAAAEYQANNPDMSYEDFLKERGLDTGSLIRNGLVDMTVSSVIGGRTGHTEVLAQEAQALTRALGREIPELAAKQARRELMDQGYGTAATLIGEAIKGDGTLSVEALTQAVLDAPVSTLVSRMRIDIAEQANHKNTADADTQIKDGTPETLNTEHTTQVDPDLDADGKTVTEIKPDGTREDTVSLRPEVEQAAQDHSAATREARTTKLEETIHASQEPVDAFQRDEKGKIKLYEDGKPIAMTRDENYARRSLNEMRAEFAAKHEVLTGDRDATTNPQERAQLQKALETLRSEYGKKLSKTEELIASGKHKEALDFAKENGITEADIENYKADYDHNVARDLETGILQQTNLNATDTETLERITGGGNNDDDDISKAQTSIRKIQTLEELQTEGAKLLTEANGNAQKIQELIKARETEIYHSTIDKALETKPELAHELSNLRKNENPEIRRIATEALAAKNPEETSRVIKALNNLDLTNINDPLVQRVLENTPYAKTNNKDGDPVDQAIKDIETQISLLNRYNGDSGPASPHDSPEALLGLSDHLDTLKKMVAKDGVSAKEDADMEALHLKAYQTIEEAQKLFEKLQPQVLQHVKRGGAEPTELQQQYAEKLKELERITKAMSNTAVDIIDRNFARRKELHDLGINEDQYKMVRDIYTNPEEAKAAAEKISSNLIDTVRPQLETEDLNATYLGIDKAVDQLKTENEAIQEALALDYLIQENGSTTTPATLSTLELKNIEESNSKAIGQLEQLKKSISSFQSNTNGRKNEAQEKALKSQAKKINEELAQQKNKIKQSPQTLEQKQNIKTKLGLSDDADLSKLSPEELVKFNEILGRKNLSETQKELLRDAIKKKGFVLDISQYFRVLQMNPKIVEVAVDFTKSNKIDRIKEIEQRAKYLNEIKDFKGFDEYISNLKEIRKEYDIDFMRQDMVNYKIQKIEDLRPSELEKTMQGFFAEKNVLRIELSNTDRNIQNIGSTGILSDKIIDSDGKVLFDAANDGMQSQSIALERRGDANYELIDRRTGEAITVRNGNNQATKIIVDDGILKSNNKPVSIVYDKESGRYIAREIDLVSRGNMGNIQDRIFLQEIKDKASTARNKYNSDEGRQFKALIAISKHLGATPVIRINESRDVLIENSNRYGDRSFNETDRAVYRQMVQDAKAMGVDLIFADKDGNIINI